MRAVGYPNISGSGIHGMVFGLDFHVLGWCPSSVKQKQDTRIGAHTESGTLGLISVPRQLAIIFGHSCSFVYERTLP
jgi:hypothetical protein